MATVDALTTQSNARLDAQTQMVKDFVDILKAYALEGITVGDVDLTGTNSIASDSIAAVNAAASATQPPIFTLWASSIKAPEAPTVGSVVYGAVGNAPEFALAAPTVSLPPVPDANLPGAPGEAPEFKAPTIPDYNPVKLPDAPEFQNIVIPTIPNLPFPTFTELAPTDDIFAPTNDFVWNPSDYSDRLLDELKAKLEYDLLNGGYGIDNNDEQRLWTRERDRESMNAETQIQDAMRKAASRGFAMPPGALNALVQAAQEAAMSKLASVSREIMIKKADLFVENRKFTIQEVRQLEDMLYKYWSFAQERVLNAAKYTAEFGIQVFNASVARYNARMEGYKAKATVFKTLVDAVLANLESYKIQMEGARLAVDIQKLHADVYRTQVEGATALINLYKVQMEAAQIQAEVEKIKMDAFRASVEAYTAQVGAKSAEFGMYKAQIEGEMSKVEIFKSQVQAYGEQIAAYSARVNAADTEVKSKTAIAELTLAKYKTQIEAYRAQIEAAQTDIRAASEKYSNDIRKYEATVAAFAKVSDETTNVAKNNADIALSKAKVYSSHILGQAEKLTAHAQMGSTAAALGVQHIAAAITGTAGQVAAIQAKIE